MGGLVEEYEAVEEVWMMTRRRRMTTRGPSDEDGDGISDEMESLLKKCEPKQYVFKDGVCACYPKYVSVSKWYGVEHVDNNGKIKCCE